MKPGRARLLLQAHDAGYTVEGDDDLVEAVIVLDRFVQERTLRDALSLGQQPCAGPTHSHDEPFSSPCPHCGAAL